MQEEIERLKGKKTLSGGEKSQETEQIPFVLSVQELQKMDITVGFSFSKSPNLCNMIPRFSSSSRFRCSKRNPDESPKTGNDNGDKSSRDWDKAWKNFKKQSKKTLFSQFNVDKYVTWNPPRSEFPLSEEVDPIKRAERSNLMLWTSPKFTLVGAIVIISFLLVYTILAPLK